MQKIYPLIILFISTVLSVEAFSAGINSTANEAQLSKVTVSSRS